MEVIDLVQHNIDPFVEITARFSVGFVQLTVEFDHGVLALGVPASAQVLHQFEYAVLQQHHSYLFCRNPLILQMGQIVIDSLESQVDGVFALVVHAHAYKHLDSQRLVFVGQGVRLLAHVHLVELVEQPVGLVDRSQVAVLRSPRFVEFRQVVGLNRAGVYAERSAFVVHLLLEHSRRGVDVDGWVAWPQPLHFSERELERVLGHFQ